MRIPEIDLGLLAVVAGGAFVKVITSKRLTLWGGIVTVTMAVFSAVVFTEPIAYLLGVEETSLTLAIAALLTLTGEGVVRTVIDTFDDKESAKSFIVDMLRAWRGK